MAQFELKFDGRGSIKVDARNYDDAMDVLLEALADAGIDFEIEEAELFDENGAEVE